MSHHYLDIAFTDDVKAVQEQLGSRQAYSRHDSSAEDVGFEMSEREATFIAARDSFYMASVNSEGWPYVQHRGGPQGFLKVLDAHTLGFTDFRGNRQYVSVGNLKGDNRVSLFLMDYPNRRRLKMFGRVETVELDHPLIERLQDDSYKGKVERGFLIHVEGFDWNCPQHITPRFSEDEIRLLLDPA